VASGAARGLVPPQVTDNVRSVAFDRNGLLASGDPDGRVLIWSNPGDETPEARPLWGHGAAITALAFSADGTRLLSGSADGAVLWRDVRGGQPLEMVIDDREGRAAGAGNPFFRIAGLALSPDGRTSAAQRGRAIGLWDTASGAPRPSLPVKAAGDASMAFTPDGKILAVAGGDGVTLWDVARREVVGSPVQHKTEIDGRSISPDGTIIAIRQPDRAVLLWDIAARRASGNLLTGHQADLTDLAFSPNGKALASGAKDGVVTVWDVAGRRPLRAPLEGHDGRVEGLRFSPDGRALAVIASGNQTSTVTLWDLKRSARAELLSKRRVRPATLLFSPDGKTLVTAAERRSPERRDVESDLLLWDVANLQAPATSLRGHDAPIVEFAFAAEGDSLVSVDEKRTVILWDVARRVSIGRLVMGHPQGVRSAAFDRDASRMLSSGLWGASLIVTDWRPRSWATYACQAANRDLNPDEWRRIAGAEFPYQAACPPPPGPD
jgi:WD40 repeat protein